MKKKIGFVTLIATFGILFTSCGTSEITPTSKYNYTLNTALSTFPKGFNPHNWETSDENYIPSFTTMGLYQISLNEQKNGYVIENEMALSAPVDAADKVSPSDRHRYGYQGQVGKGFVYDIALNPSATWEDGSLIKAEDYVESMKRVLSPKMSNFRADSFYASSLVLANAESYFKQGKITVEPLYEYLVNSLDGTPTDSNVLIDNVYLLNLGKATPFYANVFPMGGAGSLYSCLAGRPRSSTPEAELAAKRIVDATQNYLFNYVDHSNNSNWTSITQATQITDDDKLDYNIDIHEFDNNTIYVRKTMNGAADGGDTSEVYSSSKLKSDLATFAAAMGTGSVFKSSWAYALPLFGHMENTNTVDFESVGIKAVDDYKIRLYLSQKMTAFDLQFSLTSNWLVKTDLYDKLTKPIPGSDMYATSYATDNVDNYMSYGPYRLETFQKGKAITMVKNEKWYGYRQKENEGKYQCDRIVAQYVPNHASQRQLFLAGQLDSLDLQKSDTKDYGSSSRTKYIPESYTQKISLNSDRAKLRSRQDQTSEDDNKTILNNLKFRTALSLAIDRKEFANNVTAGSQAFTGLLNGQYMIDSKIGTTYRSTKQGQSVYDKVYANLGGDKGGEMLNPNEVAKGYTDNRSGYNKNYAIELIRQAIEEEQVKEDGIKEGQKITLEFLVSQTPEESEVVRDSISYLTTAFNAVTKPNGHEVTISYKKDEDYYNTATAGNYDMIYSIWGGAINNPYGLMQVYIDANFSKNCEYGFKGHQNEINLEIEFSDGSKVTKTFFSWFDDIIKNLIEPTIDSNSTQSQIDEYNKIHTKRMDVLAGLEAGVLSRFEAIPLVSRSNAQMNSFKVEDGAPAFVTFVGYGGIKETKFNFTDSEWADFLKRHNNNLTEEYKQ